MQKMSGKIGLEPFLQKHMDWGSSWCSGPMSIFGMSWVLRLGAMSRAFFACHCRKSTRTESYTSDEPTQANRAKVRTPCIHASRLTLWMGLPGSKAAKHQAGTSKSFRNVLWKGNMVGPKNTCAATKKKALITYHQTINYQYPNYQ